MKTAFFIVELGYEKNFLVAGLLFFLGTCASQQQSVSPSISFTTKIGAGYMQFPDYAQIRYSDGGFCVFAPYEKILINESRPIECVRVSARYRDGVIPSKCN